MKKKVICQNCKHQFEDIPKRSFLAFQKFKCPECSENIVYPLTPGWQIFYWILVILLISNSIKIYSQGDIPVPGLMGIGAIGGIIALLKNNSLKNKVKDLENEVLKSSIR
ncbi:hypothetical protein IPN35_00075 [Candidatus Peregrinibacteria bacterium]|nr:MAG: hypothetical protein IPN35_00075 [Candidatus Peregrinibacteria bacterium]